MVTGTVMTPPFLPRVFGVADRHAASLASS